MRVCQIVLRRKQRVLWVVANEKRRHEEFENKVCQALDKIRYTVENLRKLTSSIYNTGKELFWSEIWYPISERKAWTKQEN